MASESTFNFSFYRAGGMLTFSVWKVGGRKLRVPSESGRGKSLSGRETRNPRRRVSVLSGRQDCGAQEENAINGRRARSWTRDGRIKRAWNQK